jgi:hypothetical protein
MAARRCRHLLGRALGDDAPAPSRAAQRRIEATQSREVTSFPSVHFSPSRSSIVSVSLSSDQP